MFYFVCLGAGSVASPPASDVPFQPLHCHFTSQLVDSNLMPEVDEEEEMKMKWKLDFFLKFNFNLFWFVTAILKFSPCEIVCRFYLPDGQKQEVSLGGGASRQCFYDLTPSSQYQISVRTQLQELEGPSVSITDMTRMLQMIAQCTCCHVFMCAN